MHAVLNIIIFLLSAESAVNDVTVRAISKLLATCGIGIWASKAKLLDRTALSVLSKLVFGLFQPCLLFSNVLLTGNYPVSIKCTEFHRCSLDTLVFMRQFQRANHQEMGPQYYFFLWRQQPKLL